MPASVSGSSVVEVCSPSRLHSVSPCRASQTDGRVTRLYRAERATSTPPSSSYAGKRSTTTPFSIPARVRSLEPLAEAAHAPLADELEAGRVGERQRGRDVASDEIRLAEPGQLEDPAADGEHPGLAVADDEAGRGGGVVVLEQLEEEAEAAAAALRRLAARSPRCRRCRSSAPGSWGR